MKTKSKEKYLPTKEIQKNSRVIKPTVAGADASDNNLAGEFEDYGQSKGQAWVKYHAKIKSIYV